MDKKQKLISSAEKEITIIKRANPKIHEDTDAVWVLSGPGNFYTPLAKDEKPFMRWMDRHRILYGVAIVHEITAKKLRKNSRLITAKEISLHGPLLIYNGLPDENLALREALKSSLAFFPEDKVCIINKYVDVSGQKRDIKQTRDQILSFPTELLYPDGPIKNRIAIVSHTEHFPRILRYLEELKPFPPRIKVEIFALNSPSQDSKEFTKEEVDKVWEYYKKGDLAWTSYQAEK